MNLVKPKFMTDVCPTRLPEEMKDYVEVTIAMNELYNERRSNRWSKLVPDEYIIMCMLQERGIRMAGTTNLKIDEPFHYEKTGYYIVIRQWPSQSNATPATPKDPAQQLQARFNLSANDLKAAIKPLFFAMLDHGITTVNVERTGNKVMLTIDGKTILE